MMEYMQATRPGGAGVRCPNQHTTNVGYVPMTCNTANATNCQSVHQTCMDAEVLVRSNAIATEDCLTCGYFLLR